MSEISAHQYQNLKKRKQCEKEDTANAKNDTNDTNDKQPKIQSFANSSRNHAGNNRQDKKS